MMSNAIDEYQYIVKHSREPEEALFALGDIYLKLKKTDEAIKCYREILRRQPKNPVAHANLAVAYAGSGKAQEELQSLKKAAALNPNEPTIRFNLGAVYERKKCMAMRRENIAMF